MFTLLLLWIALVSSFTILGSWYARRFGRSDMLIGIYVAFGIFSNIAAAKTAAFDLVVGTFYAPAVVIVFSVTFLLTDVVNEMFGLHETRRMISIAFLSQIMISLFSWIVVVLPPAPFFHQQDAIEMLLGQVPRIVLASWVAFMVSENLDAVVFAWFKSKTKGRHLWARNALSSIPAMLIDSTLFITIAFYGVMPVIPLIIGITITKWLVALIDVPFMYLNRWILYRGRSTDAFITSS
ncbi:MAG: queuosine precursor transporter [Methanothrix sp.]|nr:queuosine precursor transporter [Methanothrix sp.]MCX8206728.1 queuosine precursor transporter [Methanothrix sp.]